MMNGVPQRTLTPEREMACALLWLRNHLDVGSTMTRPIVLRNIDAILKRHGEPSVREYGEFVTTTLRAFSDV